MADHNDPNAVNSIFSDIDASAADLYDVFGFPAGPGAPDSVVVALTFASLPDTGVFDSDMLYRVRMTAHPRLFWPRTEGTLQSLVAYFDAVKDKYLGELLTAEVRVVVDKASSARIAFTGFPGGDIAADVATNQPVVLRSPRGHQVDVFIGGRDDAFFNDLTGFFRSINYAPQFYHVPQTRTDARELPIPKTLLELEGNDLFNFDPQNPQLGHTVKKDLPPGPWTWSGTSFRKDANGNFRFVYTGEDARAGKNCNAIILRIPIAFITKSPAHDRIVNIWGESWVSKAANKVETIPDHPLWIEHPMAFLNVLKTDAELSKYKLVDTTGQPFADAGLNEREDSRQIGANNFLLGPHFVKRLGHLGWGFGPSISALGLKCAFDHEDSPVSVHKTYALAVEAFPRVAKMLFQPLNMPDGSWNTSRLDIPLRRPFEIFVPNVCAVDMDTTGSWPFGRRLEDQVATRFLSLFLDMDATLDGQEYNVDTLSNQALLNQAPIEPKAPPNPLKNDKEFLADFPYLAEPW
jgi:hypothetical protein